MTMTTTATTKRCWEIKNVTDSSAELYLYGTIASESWFDDEITPKAFADDLAELGGRAVTLRINSPGGDAFAAQAMYSRLLDYGGKVTAKIDGLAASAAVLLVCAADVVEMPSNALLMIHNPMLGLVGNYDAGKLGKYADYLGTVKQTIINAYRKKVNLESKKLAKMMDAETWMTAQEAKEYGFADVVTNDPDVQNLAIQNNLLVVNSLQFDISKFKNTDGLKRAAKGEETMPIKETEQGVLEKIKNLLGITEEKKPDAAPQPQNNAPATPTKEELEQMIASAVNEIQNKNAALNALRDGSATVDAIVNEAIAGGKSAEDVKPFVEAVKNAALKQPETPPAQNKTVEAIRNLIVDQLQSGTSNISPGSGGTPGNEKEEEIRLVNQMAKIINERNGRVQ